MTRTAIPFTLSLALLGAGARAEQVQQSRSADPEGRVHIENPSGTVEVTGWDRAEVAVTGSLGPQADGLVFTSRQGATHLEVDTQGNPHGVHSRLEVRVPRGSVVEVEGFNTSITVSTVKGVHAESVNGSITVNGPADEVEVETVNGQVSVTGPARAVRAGSVNGQVTVRDAGEDVEASTVNGRLSVTAGKVRRAQLETVSGALHFEGELAPQGRLDAESVSGAVELVFSGTLDARFDVSSFSGEVDNQLGPAARRTSRYTSRREVSFSVGAGTAAVSVSTLSGEVILRKP
ncbi:MAG: DUF4097 domain-containing protein [Myxococcaceae bacterium]|nr:DUF4097 domain-containing protein [Myxococcaceae bacterium]